MRASSPRSEITEGAGNCPFCGGATFLQFSAAAYDIPGQRLELTECATCELAWQRTPKTLDSAALIQACHEDASGFWSASETSARTRRQAEFVAALMRPGRLLDVGGADGKFAVNAADMGWECTVIDPAFPSQRISPRVEIIHGLVSDLPGTPAFDVATMWSMIEHVTDYPTLLQQVFAQLRSGGKLVIEALNYQSLDRMRANENWWGFQADHQWYLSPGAYGQKLVEAGFSQWEVAAVVLRDHDSARFRELGLRAALRRAARRPWRAGSITNQFVREHAAARRWPQWYTLPLTVLVATK